MFEKLYYLKLRMQGFSPEGIKKLGDLRAKYKSDLPLSFDGGEKELGFSKWLYENRRISEGNEESSPRRISKSYLRRFRSRIPA